MSDSLSFFQQCRYSASHTSLNVSVLTSELGENKRGCVINSGNAGQTAVNTPQCGKDAAGSYNAKLISSLVISRMINESKSELNALALPLRSVIAQSNACDIKQSQANQRTRSPNRTFRTLPRRLGTPASPGETPSRTNRYETERLPAEGTKKGFASITVTSRRVDPSAHHRTLMAVSTLEWLKCIEIDLTKTATTAPDLAKESVQWRPLDHQKPPEKRDSSTLKVFSLYPPAGSGLVRSHVNEAGSTLETGRNIPKKGTTFCASLYRVVSPQRHHAFCYLDKSLCLTLRQCDTKGQSTERSLLSFNVKCSNPRSPAGGVASAPKEAPCSALEHVFQKVKGRPEANANVTQNNSVQTQPLLQVDLETKHTHASRFSADITSPILEEFPTGNPSVLVQERARQDFGNAENKGKASKTHLSSDWLQVKGTCPLSGLPKKQKAQVVPVLAASQASVKDFGPFCQFFLTGHHQHSESNAFEPKSFIAPSQALDENSVYLESHIATGDKKCCNVDEDERGDKGNTKYFWATIAERQSICNSKIYMGHKSLASRTLTLREALELHRPGFISHSRKRMQKLERMAERRKAQSSENLGSERKLISSFKSAFNRKRLYTVPHPLSDNLFRPRERTISEKEMQLRSKRIYNSLPEVKKKLEDKQKQVVLQSNRQRAELFKKTLLKNILHRNTD